MTVSIAIIINNYLHDLATGALLASAVILLVLARRAERFGGGALGALASARPALARIATIALAWILLGGIPRAIFFTRYEWDPAVVKGIVPALIVKHVLMSAAVVVGALLWRRGLRVLDAAAERPATGGTTQDLSAESL